MGRPGWLFPQDTRVRAGQYAGIILGFGISWEDASRGTVHVAKIRLARPSGSHAEGDTVIVPQADLIPVACVAGDSPWNSSHWDPPADAIRVLLHVPARMLGGVRPGSEDGTWQIGTVNGFTTGIPEDGEWCLRAATPASLNMNCSNSPGRSPARPCGSAGVSGPRSPAVRTALSPARSG